jgi:hypothetical protein
LSSAEKRGCRGNDASPAILPEQLEASSPFSRSNAEIGYRILDWQSENQPQGDPEEQIII